MKKKIIIVLTTCLVLIVGVICFLIKRNNSGYIITLDINPSIQINVSNDDVVKKVVALNSDAKKIVSNKLENISLKDALNTIVEKVIDNGFVDADEISIVFYSSKKTDDVDTIDFVRNSFETKNIHAEIIIVDKITSEDKKLAKKYNISPAKASYVNSVLKEKDNIPVENLVDKSIDDLRETKDTGWYCDTGYILEGSNCLKEIERTSATYGDICPRGYYEYNNKCYEEVGILESDKLICNDDFTLKDDKCIREEVVDAEPKYSCSKGELKTKRELFMTGDAEDSYYCVDKTNAKAPTLRCLTHNHTMINGKCANGPKPTINGGCIEGDYLVNGGCYDIDNEDQWVCPDGNIYEKSKGTYVELCPDTMTYTKPTITGYSCQKDFKLKDNKCVREEKVDAFHERYCKSGYDLVDNDKCINYSNTASKEKGYICTGPDSRLRGNVCVSYKLVDAKK